MLEMLAHIWETLRDGSSSLSEFDHLMAMVFGCSLAYAALIRAGKLQGDHLEDFCTIRHGEAELTHEFLASEKPTFISDFDLDLRADRLRCLNHVAAFRKRITYITNWFSIAALTVAVVCILGQIVAAIWEPHLPNYALVIITLLAFTPVPLGLGVTMYIVRGAESEIQTVYEPFFVIVGKIKFKVDEEKSKAIQKITIERKKKRRGWLYRMFFGDDESQ